MQPETYIELSRVEVADKARQLWKADGKPNGRSLEYRLQAEVELLNSRGANMGLCSEPPPRIAQAAIYKPREFE
jgi:Protein of unknown function (DUF2934)